MTGRRALVLGITGQDGGYLAEALAAEGTLVHGVRRPGHQSLPPHLAALGDALKLHGIDLDDEAALSAVVGTVRPHEIYNLAAQSSVEASWSLPGTTVRMNALLPALLLEAAHRLQQDAGRPVRVLQASSAEIFGGGPVVPQDEDTPLVPSSPYGAAKAHAHVLTGLYRARGLHAVTTVLYPHESPRRSRAFVTRKITATVAAIARGEVDELVLGNLAARRDWGWAPDFVEAMVLALRHDVPDDYVVATGRSHTVADFAEAAFARAGLDRWRDRVRSDSTHVRPRDAADLVGDARKAERVLGWRPRVVFPEVVDRMVDHDLAGAGAAATTPRPPPAG